MNKPTDAAAKGRDSVTDAMDAYLLNGVGAVEGWIGLATQREQPEFSTAYMLGCAVIHAAEIVAQALDRQAVVQSRCSRRRNF